MFYYYYYYYYFFFHENYFYFCMFRDVPECSGMFRHVPECSMFRILSTANDYPCCLQFSFLTPQWLFLRNTIIFRKINIPGVHGSVSFTVSHAESYRRNDYIYFPLIHSTFMIRRTTTVAFVCQLCFLPHGRPVILAPHSF